MAYKKSVELPTSVMITVVSRRGKAVYVQDMPIGDALDLKERRKDWKHLFYQLGFTSVKSNVPDLGVALIPKPPKRRK